jgi:hypothetical protein
MPNAQALYPKRHFIALPEPRRIGLSSRNYCVISSGVSKRKSPVLPHLPCVCEPLPCLVARLRQHRVSTASLRYYRYIKAAVALCCCVRGYSRGYNESGAQAPLWARLGDAGHSNSLY